MENKVTIIIPSRNIDYLLENCIKQMEKIMQGDMQEQVEKGRIGRKIRAMILGIPNVRKIFFY